MILSRRGFIGGLAALAAPAIVKAEILMPVKTVVAARSPIVLPPNAPVGTYIWSVDEGSGRDFQSYACIIKLPDGAWRVDKVLRVDKDSGAIYAA